MKLISPVIFSFVAAWSFTSVYTPAVTGTALFQPKKYTKNTTESLLRFKWHENFTIYPKETQKHLQSIWSIRNAGHTHSISRFFGSGFGFVFLWLPSMFSLLRNFHWTIHFLFWCNRRKIRLLQDVLTLSITGYYLFCLLLFVKIATLRYFLKLLSSYTHFGSTPLSKGICHYLRLY